VTPRNRGEAALDYAERFGWPVFPVRAIVNGRCDCDRPACGDIGKHPRIPRWQLQATTDPTRIRYWWGRWPQDGIGIAHQTVLDVDPRHGGDETLAALEAEHGPLPLTPRQLTGGGGVHYLFAANPEFANRSNILPGLDTRGRNGFIVAAPSPHRSGREYVWDACAHPLEVPLAEAPAWLVQLVAAKAPTEAACPVEEWVRLLRDGAGEGARDVTLTRLAGHLLRRRVDPHVVMELLRVWNATRCRPPLDDAQVEKVLLSVMRKELRRREAA
jgi:hypothetical protein